MLNKALALSFLELPFFKNTHMSKRRKGLILVKDGKFHKIATLFWNDKEGSVYLTLNKVETDGGIGKFQVKKGKWMIPFRNRLEKIQVVHSTVHRSGISLMRTTKDKAAAREEGIPLKDLRVARPLWTIIPRITDDTIYAKKPKSDDFIFEEPAGISGRALYLIAFPKQDLNLQFSDQINTDGSIPNLGVFSFDFDNYLVIVLLHSNDRMIEPQQALNIPAIQNHSAWVDAITNTKVTGTYKKITQNDIL